MPSEQRRCAARLNNQRKPRKTENVPCRQERSARQTRNRLLRRAGVHFPKGANLFDNRGAAAPTCRQSIDLAQHDDLREAAPSRKPGGCNKNRTTLNYLFINKCGLSAGRCVARGRQTRSAGRAGGGWRCGLAHAQALERSVATGRGAVWLARLLWEQEVGSSNLPAPIFIRRDVQNDSRSQTTAQGPLEGLRSLQAVYGSTVAGFRRCVAGRGD